MKKIILIILLIFSQLIHSQAQREMTEKAKNDYNMSENQLNTIYFQILKTHKSNPIFVKHFKKNQQIWTKLKKSEIELKYPKIRKSEYGSVLPMCKWIYLTKINKARIKKLNSWFEKAIEGDVCN